MLQGTPDPSRLHSGLDFWEPANTPVLALGSGLLYNIEHHANGDMYSLQIYYPSVNLYEYQDNLVNLPTRIAAWDGKSELDVTTGSVLGYSNPHDYISAGYFGYRHIHMSLTTQPGRDQWPADPGATHFTDSYHVDPTSYLAPRGDFDYRGPSSEHWTDWSLQNWCNTQGGWSLSLVPDRTPVRVGTTVTLTATANKPISGNTKIQIIDQSDNQPLPTGCTTTTCTAHVNSDHPTTFTYTAKIVSADGSVLNPVIPQAWVTWVAPPVITSISPNSGPPSGGTSIMVTGTNFTGATSVLFGSTPATTFAVNSDTQITAVSPPGSAGTVDVRVTTPGGTSATSSADQFTWQPQALNWWDCSSDDPNSSCHSTVIPPDDTRTYSTAALGTDGKIYNVGGWNGYELNYVSTYAPGDSSWTGISGTSSTRYLSAASTGSGNYSVYVFGGFHVGSNGPYNEVEGYNLDTKSWDVLPATPDGQYGAAAIKGQNGKIYVFGGEGNGGAMDTVQIFDPGTNALSGSWSTGAPMPTARTYAVAGLAPDGHIYVIGGYNDNLGRVNAVEEYDPSTNSWACSRGDTSARCQSSTLAPLPTPRAFAGGGTASDGRIYVVGGTDATDAVNTVEAFNPTNNSWSCSTGDASAGCTSTSIAAMPAPRAAMGVTVGPDGRIFAIDGGQSWVEAYHP